MFSNSKFLCPKSFSLSLGHSKNQHSVLMFPKPTVSEKFSSSLTWSAKQMSQGHDSRRHFVLVHGACHGAWSWYKVSALLKSAGHNVTALDMAASGVHAKQVQELHSLSDYFEPLSEFMASLPPEERVVLVGHSIGGLGISIAMEKFSEKISAGVFVAATMPGPELTYRIIAEKFAQRATPSMDNQVIFGNGPNNPPTATLLGPNYMTVRFYYLSPPEDLELAKSLVRPFPMFSPAATDSELVLTKEKYGSVPRVYILCDEKNNEILKWMIENNPPDEVKFIHGSDHMVIFSKPQELSSCLEEIGDKYL